jgi:DNA-binding transcriptional LysR family regulator
MDLKTLENFLVLSEKLNYRKSAEEIYIAQPALSRQIMVLEEEINVKLFERNKRNVSLTAAGKYFKEESRRIIDDFDRVKQKALQIHTGRSAEIKIAHSSSSMQFLLPNILSSIQIKLPLFKTSLLETTNIFEINALLNRTIDVGFGPNILVPNELSTKTLYAENFVVILPENHELSTQNFDSIAQLSGENFILPPREESSGYVESIEAMCQAHGFIPKVAYQSGNSNTVLRLVEAGIGVSIEPKSALMGQNMNIKFIELKNTGIQSEMRMVWLNGREKELELFFDIVDDVVKQNIPKILDTI